MITEEQGKGAIINKSPLKIIVKIAPNIYNIDIGSYFNLFFYVGMYFVLRLYDEGRIERAIEARK